MKTLDEVIDYAEKWTENFDDGSLEKQMLFYLKMYRSDSRQWEADRKNWENIRFTAVDEYNEARDRLIAKCKILEIGTLNEPLAWDELRQMEGKPVWVEKCQDDEPKGWLLILRTNADVVNCTTKHGNSFYLYRSLYGEKWQAYRKERNGAAG